ncbi:hypothetical protein GCM10028781_10690 [Nostocoides australiense]
MIRRLLLVLASLIVGWLSAMHPVPAIAAPAVAGPIYHYDARDVPEVAAGPAVERGPLSAEGPAATYRAVDRWWRGALARPAGVPPLAATTYDHPVRLMGGAQATGTTQRVVRGDAGTLSPLPSGSVAAKGAASAGDHIVLGLRAHGLEETAAKVGGRTLLKDPDWMASLRKGIADPSTKFTVSLDGMSGS